MKLNQFSPVFLLSTFLASSTAFAGEAKTFDEIMKKLNAEVASDPVAAAKPKVVKKAHAKRVKKVAENADRIPAGERAVTVDSNKSATRPSQADLPVPEEVAGEDNDTITGDWVGKRVQLSKLGVNIALVYKAEFNRVLSNGLSHQPTYLGNVDLRVAIDAEKLLGWKGGSAFFYVLNDHGGKPSERVGDLQVTSNIEAPAETTKLYEAWIQQLAFDDKVSFLVGLHDLNSEFYVTDTSGLFFNASFGIGKELSQTGTNGPSIFPNTAPAVRVRVEPTKSFYAQVGVFNGQAGDPENRLGTNFRLNAKDGTLIINEFAFLNGKEGHGLYGKYGLGFWNYSKPFDHLTEQTYDSAGNASPAKAPSRGAYFIGEQNLSEMISVFLRYGVASAETNRFGSCLSTGIVFTGLLPGRSKDRFGLALASSKNGSEYETAQAAAGNPVGGAENTYEANYRFELSHGIAIQPDFQYVVNPSTDTSRESALVGALRLELSL